jgi:ribose 1,5-bisphosphokinase
MSWIVDTRAFLSTRHDQIGPGRLVLVVGPSGAGKDTLLALAKAGCADDASIVFPQRVVTREASASEDNLMATRDRFDQSLAQGGFAMHWEAHGHSYGVPRAIDDDIRAGRTVVVNVSRTVIAALRGAYATVTVVLINAPQEILATRLAARSRSSDGKIDDRLGRTVEREGFAPDVVVDNVGDAGCHADELARIIRGG